MNHLQVATHSFLAGGGEMGERIRSSDWSASVLGSPDTWPQSLRTTVSIILNSQFPMFVWWGEELITIYNDAYCPIAGEKHPELLGRSGKEAWIEIWNDLGPLVESVFAGRSTWSEDQPLYMNRYGYVEETYFTFSYSPVRDESGKVAGLFCACIETTQQVLAGRKIKESERNLRATILQSPVAMSILKGPDFRVEIANDRMYELWGKGPEQLLQRPIFEGLPEARNQGLEALLQQVYQTGEAYAANERPVLLPRDGGIANVYLNFVYEPFREGDGSISGIIAVGTDVTEQVMARKRIEQSEHDLQQAVFERTLELERKNGELRRSNANLEEFAYAASHDLKEPIRKIHFFSDRLKGELAPLLSENQKHLFGRLENATQRMGTLIRGSGGGGAAERRRDHFG
jgi:PAS domain S-box-containing protein